MNKKVNQEKRPKRFLRANGIGITIGLISLFGMACMAANIVMLYFGKIDSAEFTVASESTFIETGLTLIGCALAVWAGTNIVNAIERKDIEAIQNDLSIAEEQLKVHQEHQTTYEKNLFVSELLKSSVDLPTKMFAEQMQEARSANWGNVPYQELLHVEQAFSQVLSIHEANKLNGTKNDELILKIAEDGLTLAKELIKRPDIPEKIVQFLTFRMAEFNFYKGYNLEGYDAICSFLKAIPDYGGGMALFDVTMPVFDEALAEFPIEIRQDCAEDKKAIAAYMCNTIGAAYIEITHQINKHTISPMPDGAEHADKKSLFYCAYAVGWDTEEREGYARNYGCAMEHAKKEFLTEPKVFEKIRELYQKALDFTLCQGEFKRKTFKAFLSLNHKYSNKKLRLEDAQSFPDLKAMSISGMDLEYLLDYAERSKVYADMAVCKYPDTLQFFKLQAFVYRDLAILYKMKNDDEKSSTYYRLMEESTAALKFLYPEDEKRDDYTRELIHQCNLLSNYIVSGNQSTSFQVIIDEVKVKKRGSINAEK